MKKKKILDIRKNKDKWEIEFCNIEKYKDTCGVWVMYNESEDLLEVAQTSNIFKELDYDLSWIMKEYSKEINRDKCYTARRLFDFNKKFDILQCDKNRTTAKYRDIAENYKRIIVYVVLEDEAVSDNRAVREQIELKIAIDNRAKYWNAFGKQRKEAKEYFCKIPL